MKNILFRGLLSGILSAISGIVYLKIYEGGTMVDFESVLSPIAVASTSIFACMLMTLGYMFLFKMRKMKWKGAMNLLILLFSFLSIFGPIAFTLPLEFDYPELFPGLAIPMHFFPALFFFALHPFFEKGRN